MIQYNILIIGKWVGMDLVILYRKLNNFPTVYAVATRNLLAFAEFNFDHSCILVACKEIKLRSKIVVPWRLTTPQDILFSAIRCL